MEECGGVESDKMQCSGWEVAKGGDSERGVYHSGADCRLALAGVGERERERERRTPSAKAEDKKRLSDRLPPLPPPSAERESIKKERYRETEREREREREREGHRLQPIPQLLRLPSLEAGSARQRAAERCTSYTVQQSTMSARRKRARAGERSLSAGQMASLLLTMR